MLLVLVLVMLFLDSVELNSSIGVGCDIVGSFDFGNLWWLGGNRLTKSSK